MFRIMHKSKIHGAYVTSANLNYRGSITLDPVLIRAANLMVNEKVQVVNCNNGARFETYIIEGREGSGDIFLNGAAARLGEVGDKIIVISYALYSEDELKEHKAEVVMVDEWNQIVEILKK